MFDFTYLGNLLALFTQAMNWLKEMGISGTAFGLVVGFFISSFRERRTRVNIEFENGDEFLGLHTRLVEKDGKPVQSQYLYFRGRVKNKSSKVAHECRTYLTKIERKQSSGQFRRLDFSDNIQLAWSARAAEEVFSGLAIPNKLDQFFDVFFLLEADIEKGLQLRLSNVPTRYRRICDEAGTYRFTVFVSGDNVKPAVSVVTVEWTAPMSIKIV